ncbi:MAG TPA: glycosyltransferase [Candidatus Binatia bacterium]|nr:glycosyltransferase [Candidatus Binatia bacterium]
MARRFSTSVVIPTFNRSGLLAEAIKSVVNQTVVPEDIVVVDDGSTDGTPEVVRGFGDPVRLIRIANTGVGPSRPRNVGIAAAASRYITLLDSDDLLLPTLLEHRKAAFERYPGLGLAFNKSLVARRTPAGLGPPTPREEFQILRECCREQIGDATYRIGRRDAYSALCKGNYILTATGTTFPKTAWEEVGGFDESGGFTTSNDYEFFFRVVARYDIAYIDKPLQIYCHHASNISTANLEKEFKPHRYTNWIRVLERELRTVRSAKDRASLEESMTTALLQLAYGYRKTRDYRHALAAYLRSVRHGGLRWDSVTGTLKLPVAWVCDRLGVRLGRSREVSPARSCVGCEQLSSATHA